MRTVLSTALAVLTFSFAVSGVAQTVQFDTVSVKPMQFGSRGGPGPFVNTNAGRMQARGPLTFFIELAYGLRDTQIEGGAGWVRNDRFDIDAVLPAGVSTVPAPAMLQPVLADRFKLTFHRLTRDTPILALVTTKSGPKFKVTSPDDQGSTRSAPGQLIARRMTMRQLASMLDRGLGRPVEDRTKLTGEYSFTLTWTPDEFQAPDPRGRPPVNPDAPTLPTALEEQLGLKLENARGQIQVFIIDSAERPQPN